MIPQSQVSCQTDSPHQETWQSQLINAVRDPAELCRLLKLTLSDMDLSGQAHRDFPLLVPRAFVDLMEPGNAADPLLLQVLNRKEEEFNPPGFSEDPLQEEEFTPLPGMVHKYHGRVLLIVTGKCAINCRYCFRRSFAYADNNPGKQGWLKVIDYIRERKEISEVIFSGGDPLSAPDKQLAWLTEQLGEIPHLRRLRIHTRLPVVIPDRINADFLDWVSATRLRVQIVLHINHPNEIGDGLGNAVDKLVARGIQPLNQSVLLRGINDDVDTLQALQEIGFDAGILPYYLFCLDQIKGASHFEVPQEKAHAIWNELKYRLPGYLVPRLAIEEPGKKSKTLLL
ncbi:MAG: EF-P beta-lysylation protein EpmB [Porticoccaceae bacterium]